MKSIRFISVLSLLAGGLLLPARAGEEAATAPAPLVVRVEAPFVTDLTERDDVEHALFWRVKDAITAKHRDAKLEPAEGDIPAGTPVLTLTLIHWRTNRMGDVECRFSAEYSSADGRRVLGHFEGMTSSIVRSRGFASQDFERAAEEAGRRLGAVLQEIKLI